MPSACPPPTGPNSFVFAYIFTEKCPRWRPKPPKMGPRPLRKILDPALFKLQRDETYFYSNFQNLRKCIGTHVTNCTGIIKDCLPCVQYFGSFLPFMIGLP